ncbi:hypothetical protein RHMOL_Rhmol07G0305600 [Rhododendron molle]|uniref:Uncharacterized protein n=1 Tax=Rhododendron molle TaxID=49168 RepID=A0ACC0N697_RHOML|nr:hypothetical protein RHMOL_Rhmol07G0305600 [Rhododendron molle]
MHRAVLEAAVVGRPDGHGGGNTYLVHLLESKDGSNVTSDEIIRYCCDLLPRYMAPRTVDFRGFAKNFTLERS